MCGICGKFVFDVEASVDVGLLKSMLSVIRHRGPDDNGYYVGPQVGLGHARLSIIDLNTGHQPICNEDQTVWVVFNGEIYNYHDLRRELIAKGHTFKTESDTEVIVHLYEESGPAFVERLRGMFAIALYDVKSRTLVLSRDRVGIKPLYYYLTDRFLVFGSEMKAVLADPVVKRELLPAMVDRFLTFFYMPGEETLFKNLVKLAPGSYLIVRDGHAERRQYWDLSYASSKTLNRGLKNTEDDLLALLEETVNLHMISDVPVGVLLSGGVDSTAMLSLASGQSGRKLSTFTVGFSEPDLADERSYAKIAAANFDTQHHELTIDAQDFADFLPLYVWHMEEPVCEPPAIALYYVSRLAKANVKVLISGEGADEAFAGYSNYRNLVWLERLKSCLGPFEGMAAKLATGSNQFISSARVRKYAKLMGLPLERYYYSRTSTPFLFFNNPSAGFYSDMFLKSVDKSFSTQPVSRCFANGIPSDTLNKMLYVDTKTWLPDDLLVKADKMTMANSIELRVPFLDHKVLEFAASLPCNYKLRGLTGKYIAKRALRGRVPKAIINRPKAGFPVPYASWLRKELRQSVRDILFDRKTIERGYFQRQGVEALLSEEERYGGFSKEIFSLVVLELWHRSFLEST